MSIVVRHGKRRTRSRRKLSGQTRARVNICPGPFRGQGFGHIVCPKLGSVMGKGCTLSPEAFVEKWAKMKSRRRRCVNMEFR